MRYASDKNSVPPNPQSINQIFLSAFQMTLFEILNCLNADKDGIQAINITTA